jgi:hypothetical protein
MDVPIRRGSNDFKLVARLHGMGFPQSEPHGRRIESLNDRQRARLAFAHPGDAPPTAEVWTLPLYRQAKGL